jgi:hypothetical protein
MSSSANGQDQETLVTGPSAKALHKSKAISTERDFPHIIEIDLPLAGLDVRLSRAMGKFHESNDITPHFGRTRTKKDHHYCRWCFSDPAVADAFRTQFGGELVTDKA